MCSFSIPYSGFWIVTKNYCAFLKHKRWKSKISRNYEAIVERGIFGEEGASEIN